MDREFTIIGVQAEFITEFKTHQEWVNEAASRLGGFSKLAQTIICLDRQGKTCNIEADFMYADHNNLFPIKAYRLVRTAEVTNKIVVTGFSTKIDSVSILEHLSNKKK